MKHTETELEKACCLIARQYGLAAVKIEKVGHVGIPDRLFVQQGGKILFVEFKRPDGKGLATREQRTWSEYLGEAHRFIDNAQEFYQCICEYFKLTIKI